MDYREFIFMVLLCHFCFCLAINLPKALLLLSYILPVLLGRGLFSSFRLSYIVIPHPKISRVWFVIAVVAAGSVFQDGRALILKSWHFNGILLFHLVSVNGETASVSYQCQRQFTLAHNKFFRPRQKTEMMMMKMENFAELGLHGLMMAIVMIANRRNKIMMMVMMMIECLHNLASPF